MAVRNGHRDAIVKAAADLFRRRGYAATGLNDIVTESGAPKGSVYHYFPQGKAQIGVAAVALAGGVVVSTLEKLAREASGPADLMRRYAGRLAAWMQRSQWTQGCPIATVLLETAPADPGITEAGHQAFAAWAAVLEQALANAGAEPRRGARLAGLAIAALEGALIQARVVKAETPIIEAGEEIACLFEAACAKA